MMVAVRRILGFESAEARLERLCGEYQNAVLRFVDRTTESGRLIAVAQITGSRRDRRNAELAFRHSQRADQRADELACEVRAAAVAVGRLDLVAEIDAARPDEAC